MKTIIYFVIICLLMHMFWDGILRFVFKVPPITFQTNLGMFFLESIVIGLLSMGLTHALLRP